MQLLTMGGVSVDLFFHLEQSLHPLKPVMIAQSFALHPGGKAFNLALVTRRLFPETDVNILAALGGEADFFSQHLRQIIAQEKLGMRYLCTHAEMSSPVVNILTAPSPTGIELVTIPYEATGRALNEADLDIVDWHAVDALIATCEINIEAALAAFSRLKKVRPNAITVLNIAPAEPIAGRLPELAFRSVDYLVLNWHEWATLMQQPDESVPDLPTLKIALQELHAITQVPRICMTLGEQGGMFYTPQQTMIFPAYRIVAKNPVGAGDTFVASWVGKLLAQNSLQEALRFACAAAACACQDNVAIGEHVSLEKIMALMVEQGAMWDADFRIE